MDDQFEYVNCLICGKDDTEVFVRGNGPARIVRCRNDGFLFLNPRPKSSRLRESFREYVPNISMFTDFRRDVLRREARVIKKVKPGGNLLDIGCSIGTFFENFDIRNWHLYGIEPSLFNAREAQSRYPAEVFCGVLQEAKYPTAFFDVITVLDTIYYFPDLKSDLLEIRRCLKDDGLLAIEIQGINYWLLRDKGPICWLLERKWSRMSTHSSRLYYFSPLTLRLLLEATGFRVVGVVPEQASLSKGGLVHVANNVHFALAKLLFKATAGRFSIAGRELYLAMKMK